MVQSCHSTSCKLWWFETTGINAMLRQQACAPPLHQHRNLLHLRKAACPALQLVAVQHTRMRAQLGLAHTASRAGPMQLWHSLNSCPSLSLVSCRGQNLPHSLRSHTPPSANMRLSPHALQKNLQSLVATLCKTELEMTAAHQPR